jgi:hypothetical protein
MQRPSQGLRPAQQTVYQGMGAEEGGWRRASAEWELDSSFLRAEWVGDLLEFGA